MTDPDPLHIVGELIADKYRIERMVGEGGFAVVYRAEHVVWQRPVAVKLFNGLAQAPMESRDALQRDERFDPFGGEGSVAVTGELA